MNMPRKMLPALFATLLLAACSNGISGTYAGGMGSLTFASGKVDAILLGNTIEMNYTTDGDKIVLQSAQGNLVVTRKPDGSLDTPWGNMKPKR
jgi:hypothetical protein